MKPRSAPSCSATTTRLCGEREPLEPRDDVARPGGIALVGEQRGDRLGVGRLGEAKDDRGLVGHASMVPGAARDEEPARAADRGVASARVAPARTARRQAAAGVDRRRRRRRANQTADRALAVAGERRGEPALGGGFEDGQRQPGPAGPSRDDPAARPERDRVRRRARTRRRAEPEVGRQLRGGAIELDGRPADGDRPRRAPTPASSAAAVERGRAIRSSAAGGITGARGPGTTARPARSRRARRRRSPRRCRRRPRDRSSVAGRRAVGGSRRASPGRRTRARGPSRPSRSTTGSSPRRTSPAGRPRPAGRRARTR